MQLTDSKLINLKNVFQKYPEIQNVILYGSRALGTAKSGSDIDISLKGKINLELLTKVTFDLEDLYFPEKIDISVYNEIQNKNLIEHIDKFGIKIYP